MQWYPALLGWLAAHIHALSQRTVHADSKGLHARLPVLHSLLRVASAASFFDISVCSTNREPLDADREAVRHVIPPGGVLVGDQLLFGAAFIGFWHMLQHGLPLHAFDLGSMQFTWVPEDWQQAYTPGGAGSWGVGLDRVFEELQKNPITKEELQGVCDDIAAHLGKETCDEVW